MASLLVSCGANVLTRAELSEGEGLVSITLDGRPIQGYTDLAGAVAVVAALAGRPGFAPRHVVMVRHPHTLHLNGEAAQCGIKVLQDHDAVRIGGSLFFFDAHTGPKELSQVGPTGLLCPFCAQSLDTAASIVICGCGLRYHTDCYQHLGVCGCGSSRQAAWCPPGYVEAGETPA